MLDDLAQPPAYGAVTRSHVLEEVMRHIEARTVSPAEARFQLKFPSSYEPLIELARFSSPQKVLAEAKDRVNQLVDEIHATSVLNDGRSNLPA